MNATFSHTAFKKFSLCLLVYACVLCMHTVSNLVLPIPFSFTVLTYTLILLMHLKCKCTFIRWVKVRSHIRQYWTNSVGVSFPHCFGIVSSFTVHVALCDYAVFHVRSFVTIHCWLWLFTNTHICCSLWYEILRQVKTCCFCHSRHHPSCPLTFEMHRLCRPLTPLAVSLPFSSGALLRGIMIGRSQGLAGWAVSTGFTGLLGIWVGHTEAARHCVRSQQFWFIAVVTMKSMFFAQVHRVSLPLHYLHPVLSLQQHDRVSEVPNYFLLIWTATFVDVFLLKAFNNVKATSVMCCQWCVDKHIFLFWNMSLRVSNRTWFSVSVCEPSSCRVIGSTRQNPCLVPVVITGNPILSILRIILFCVFVWHALLQCTIILGSLFCHVQMTNFTWCEKNWVSMSWKASDNPQHKLGLTTSLNLPVSWT